MTAFTSVQTGNWNDGATWGNDSPGVKGTDWPGEAGDTATIANTHVVTYNVSEANQLGIVTINVGGELTFLASMDTLLTLGDVDFVINGALTVGTLVTPIDAAYTATINHYSTSYANCPITGASSALSMCGDPDFFGSTHKATLASNYTTGQTFTIVGDYTSKWLAGQKLMLIKDGEYASSSTDLQVVTIDTIAANGGNTDITIDEAFPGGTYSEDADLFNLSRNVIYCGNGTLDSPDGSTYDTSCANFDFDQGGSVVLDSMMAGWIYSFDIYRTTINHTVFHNTYQLGTFTDCEITNIIMAGNYSGFNMHDCVGDDFTLIGCYQSSNAALSNNIIDNLRLINLGSQFGGTYSSNNFFSVEVYKCNPTYYTPIRASVANNNIWTGHFGQNANGLSYWVDDTLFTCNTSNSLDLVMTIKDFKSPAASIADLAAMIMGGYYNSVSYGATAYHIEALNGDRTEPAVLSGHGYGSLVTADGSGVEPNQRSGGHTKVWKFVTLSNCLKWMTRIVVPVKLDYLVDSVPVTLTFKVYFQSNYIGNINYSFKLISNNTVSYDVGTIAPRFGQTDWSEYAGITATFDTVGYVDIDFSIYGYESGKFIWIDPIIDIS